MSNSVPDVTLEERIDRLEHELSALKSQYETVLTGWPNAPTQAQGFLGNRWQRRDGADYPELSIPEAPSDPYYYGRHAGSWAQVVEEAPGLTARLSVTGWARASFGADVPWIPLDDVLADFATVQYVNDAIAANPSGVPDVPAVNGAYARTYLAGEAGWTDFNALGVAGLSSPAFTGVPTAPTAGAGSNSDQLATTAWVANQFNARDGDYLPRSGGQMLGPLITAPGTGPTNPGIGIGDNSTGFYRSGPGLLNITAGGIPIAQFMAQVAAFFVPVNIGNNPIQNVGDPAQPTDALNLRTGDSRYLQPAAADVRYLQLAAGGIVAGPLQVLTAPVVPNDAATKIYVDQRRAPAVVYDFPGDIAVPGDSQWHQIASIPVSIPRGGPSRIMVGVSCNVSNLPNIGLIGVRLISGTPERRVFTYGAGPPDNPVSGFLAFFTADIVGDALSVPVEVTSLSMGGAPPSFTIVGGSPSVALRSQIVIVDLGPVPTAEEANAESQDAGTGAQQRARPRPHHRRHA